MSVLFFLSSILRTKGKKIQDMENPKLTKQGKIWEREKEFLPCLSFDRYFVFLVFRAQQQQNKETETDSIIIITAIFVAPYLTNNG